MAEFDVKPKNLINDAASIDDVKAKIGSRKNEVIYVMNNLHFSSSSALAIKGRLKTVADSMDREMKSAKKLSSALSDIARGYEKHEDTILGACKDGKISRAEKQNQSPTSVTWKFGEGGYDNDIKKKRKKTKYKGYYDPKTHKWYNETPKHNKKGYDIEEDSDDSKSGADKIKDSIDDFKIVEVEKKSEWMAWGIEDDEGPWTYDVKAAYAEGHMSGYAGIFGFDADGNKIFRPGIGGEIGASFTAFSAATQYILCGDENFGVSTGVDVTVGKAEVKGEGKLGFGPEGFNAYGKLSAEAIAAEANANVDVKVAGADVKGEVGVNFGVGAHAEAGWKDNKLHLDVGLSVGLGVSADIEIDFSGTVDFVKDVASGIGDVAKSAGTTISKAVSGIAHFFGF